MPSTVNKSDVSPGLLATRLARERWCWRGGLPGRDPAAPATVGGGRGRAFGACCFAGKLRALPVLTGVTMARPLTPTLDPTRTSTLDSARATRVPPCRL